MEWMKHLSQEKKNESICQLAIPGTHDSAAFYLDPSGPLSPDENPLFSLFKQVVHTWSITQDLDFEQQLSIGIRYFDLRVAPHPETNQLHFVHGLYGIVVKNGLEQINTFLESHPSEIVILDFNHLLAFNDKCHEQLYQEILHCFGSKLAKRQARLQDVSLKNLLSNKNQVIAFYKFQNDYTELWPECLIISPWPELQNATKLIKYLKDSIVKKKDNICFVSQGVLTPDTATIITKLTTGLKQWESNVLQKLIVWLNEGVDKHLFNIVICDFVNENYAETVYKCNC